MDYSINFWDRIAERYANKPVADEATYQKKLDVTKSYLREDMKALEFGCGTGSTALELAPYVHDYQAIDVSPKMIAIAQHKLEQKQTPNLSFTQAPFEEHSVADGSLDVVLGHSILHLLNDPDEAITRVFQLLKPGGIFITSTACLADGMAIFRLIAPIGKWLRLIPSVKVFSRADLEASLSGTGFHIYYRLTPEKNAMTCFLVAVKPGSP